jgi:transposase-like protein
MKKITISTFELFALVPDAESARLFIEKRRWPDGAICPTCQNKPDRVTARPGGFYRCNDCREDFTVRTGTIFERSHIPLHKWLYAMYILVTARKGVSSLQLSKEIGVTQKTAWFMLQRIREACGNDDFKLTGTVEMDETYIGGKESNKHKSKKLNAGRGAVGKSPVLGMRQRDGKTKALAVQSVDGATVYNAINSSIDVGSSIYTDEHRGYGGLNGLLYRQSAVNHSAGEYVRGNVSTNSIESVWAVLKRGVNGVYHHVSPKHLNRYVQEFTFRLNDGNVERHSIDRMASLLKAAIGRRLTWNNLVGGEK